VGVCKGNFGLVARKFLPHYSSKELKKSYELIKLGKQDDDEKGKSRAVRKLDLREESPPVGDEQSEDFEEEQLHDSDSDVFSESVLTSDSNTSVTLASSSSFLSFFPPELCFCFCFCFCFRFCFCLFVCLFF